MWFGSGPDDCYKVIGRCESKRNPVVLLERNGTKYVYKAKPDCGREVSILQQLYAGGVAVPRVKSRVPGGFIMYFCAGQPLVDYLETQEANGMGLASVQNSLRCLVDWFANFYRELHRTQGLIMGDVNLRNFLYDGEAVTAVDFEACTSGRIEQDMGQAAAFLLNYDPPGTTWKKHATRFLLQEAHRQLQIDLQHTKAETAAEMAAMECRRHRPIPKELFSWIDSLDV